jgi:hypothetical protein
MIEKVSRNKSINLPFKYFDEQAFWCALSPNSFTDRIMACAPLITSPFTFPRLPAYICGCAITFAFPSYLIKISTLPFLPKLLPDFLAKTPTWSYLLLEILSDLWDDPISCATDSNTHFPAFLGLHPLRENFPETVHFPCPKAGNEFLDESFGLNCSWIFNRSFVRRILWCLWIQVKILSKCTSPDRRSSSFHFI